MAAKKGLSTQGLVNTFPFWSKIRNDEQSAGYQLLNTVGIQMDDLRKQTDRIGANYFLPTSIVSDIDIYYQYKLPKSYEFNMDSDTSENLFETPVVSGLIDETYYLLSLANNNNIEGFWYDAIPDRVSRETVVSGIRGDHIICSGEVVYSPFPPLPLVNSGILLVANQLTITLSGSTSCLDFRDGQAEIGLVQIEGTTRAGENIVEDLFFLFDDTKQTINDFSEVSGVYVHGIGETDEARIIVTSARLGDRSYREDIYQRTPYDLGKTVMNADMPLFWTLSSGTITSDLSQHCLELHRYDLDDLDLRLDGWVDKSEYFKTELLDEDSNYFSPLDFAVEKWSGNLWVVSSGNLYLYNDDLPYPDTTDLLGKNYNSPAVIETDWNYTVSGENLSINYVWTRPTVGMVKHRICVEHPDGTKYSLEDGSEVTYHTDSTSWTVGEPLGRAIKAPDTFTFNERGQYTFSLETTYSDGSSYIDRRIVYVTHKTPDAQFSLSQITDSIPLVGIDIDSENKLWVFDQEGDRHQINLHYDIMIIDVEKKVIYFREPYEALRVW